MKTASPLRFPGGKWRLASYFEKLISANYSQPPDYVEPFAGGASLALSLLYRGLVSRIHINDLDPAIYAFWKSIVSRNSEFLDLLNSIPVTPAEWRKQKKIYDTASSGSNILELGFATFFLNRTNHSGILNGGMIGGLRQAGEWKLNARFNRADLANRIRRVGSHRRRISVSGIDAVPYLATFDRACSDRLFYLDPPYFKVGRELYLNALGPEEHIKISSAVRTLATPWVVSYDERRAIRGLYRGYFSRRLTLRHTAREPRTGREVLFFSRDLHVPRFLKYRQASPGVLESGNQ